MKIYTVEKIFDDRLEYDCDCVCATVDMNVLLSYLNSNPLPDGPYYGYCITAYDGFTGKETHRATLNSLQSRNVKSLTFEEIK